MKPKEYLLSIGAIKEIGRGRLSVENIEKCKAAALSGISIEGYEVRGATSTTAPTVEKVKTDPNSVYDVPDEARAEELWQAYTSEGEVGMRTVEQTCGNSLTYCRCAAPKVWLDADRLGAVQFKPRTTPKKRWY